MITNKFTLFLLFIAFTTSVLGSDLECYESTVLPCRDQDKVPLRVSSMGRSFIIPDINEGTTIKHVKHVVIPVFNSSVSANGFNPVELAEISLYGDPSLVGKPARPVGSGSELFMDGDVLQRTFIQKADDPRIHIVIKRSKDQ